MNMKRSIDIVNYMQVNQYRYNHVNKVVNDCQLELCLYFAYQD